MNFTASALSSGAKKEPKPKLLSPDLFWWGGGLPREGVGAKKFGMSLETQGIKLFWRDIRDFAGISQRRPKSLRKNVSVQFLAPISVAATSSRSPHKCRYPLFVYPLFKPAQ